MEINTVLQWNCNGLRTRYEELKVLMNEQNPDCICLQEVKLNTNDFKLSTTYMSYINRPLGENRSKGGVMISIKSNIHHSRLFLRTTLQATAINIESNNIKCICNLYLPPNEHISYTELANLLEELPQPYLLLGDLNAHNTFWYSDKTNDRGRIIESIIRNFNLVCLNNRQPTYYRHHDRVKSIIDLSLISLSRSINYDFKVLMDQYGSDHYPIIIKSFQNTPYTSNDKWNIKEANWNKFYALTETKHQIEKFSSTKEAYTYFKDTIINAATQSIPKKQITKTGRPPIPWWNKECDAARKTCRSAYRKMTRRYSTTNTQIYKRRLAIKRRTFKQARRNSWEQYTSLLTSKTPTSMVWDKIKKISGKYCPKPQPIILKNGNYITKDSEVAEELAEYFANISTKQQNITNLPTINNNDPETDYNKEFNMRELDDAIQNSKDRTSPGEDQIQNCMIKHLHIKAKSFLLDLYNRIWTNADFPEEWSIATVVPILKPGKPPSQHSSYRPISLTSSLSKIMERMINNRLMWHLERYNKLSNQQFGFRKQRSTLEPIAQLTTEISQGFLRKKKTIAILFDIQKAYDTIDRSVIINNFFNLGIKGKMIKFISNYISNRKIRVKVGSSTSGLYNTNIGVPQGGILSVTCFIVGINSILDNLPHGVNASLYADDLTIYHTAKSINTSQRLIQLTINKISAWTKENGLALSSQKTEGIIFRHRKKTTDLMPELKIGNEPINLKNSVKLLGMTLDERLNWADHINILKNKGLRALNILKVIARLQWGPDRTTLQRIYWATCLSKINYGAQIYNTANPKILQKLNSVQNEALRICSGAFRSSPIEALQVENNMLPLNLQHEDLCLKYLFKLESNPKYNSLNILDPIEDPNFLNTRTKSLGFICRTLKIELDSQASTISHTVSKHPPWLLEATNICLEGVSGNKNLQSNLIQRHIFLTHLHKHLTSNYVFTDGSKSENNVGFAAIFEHRTIKGSLPNEASISTAELYAIKSSLEEILQQNEKEWTIFTDSLSSILSIRQLKPSNPLVSMIQDLLIDLAKKKKKIKFCKVPSHTGISKNEEADIAAKEASFLPELYSTQIPYTDFKPAIKKFIKSKWQLRWDTYIGKMKEIKPLIGAWKPSSLNRAKQVKLTRLRIGHTRFTHEYHMTRGRPPECIHCNGRLTVKHILLDCPKFNIMRIIHNIPTDMKSILGGDDVSPEIILKYVAQTGVQI